MTLQQQVSLQLPKKQLRIEQLPFLNQLGTIQNGIVQLQRSFKGYPLKTKVSIDLDKILSIGELGPVEYIFKSLVPNRPRLIPWLLENKTLLELTNYLYRARSGSRMGLYGYVNTTSLYCDRLNTSPDQLIADVCPNGYTDLKRLEAHRGFLQSCINELQDLGRSPGRMGGYARQIRTFYRCNGVELPKPKYLPSPKVVSRDRAPTQEELQRLLDIADARERVIILLLALGGFREGTLSLLTYRHVKEDLERSIVPVHVRIELDETKGSYAPYSSFLVQEAVDALKAYLDARRQGTFDYGHGVKFDPEEINDDSPLIRDSMSNTPRPIGEKAIYRIIHTLLHKAGLLKKNKNGGYELRVHSIRKFYKTQLLALGVQEAYIDYWMGHVTSVYNDMEMKGVDFHRNLYATAGLCIRPQNKTTRVDMLKDLVKHFGATDSEIREALQSLAKPHRIHATPGEKESENFGALAELLVTRVTEISKAAAQEKAQ